MNGLVRFALAFLVLAHGVAHLPGFIVGWKLRALPALPFTTKVLAGIDIGDQGVKVLGILWLLTGVGFAASAVGALVRATWVTSLLWPLLGLSMVLCVLGWPATRLGVVMNLLLATALAVIADRALS